MLQVLHPPTVQIHSQSPSTKLHHEEHRPDETDTIHAKTRQLLAFNSTATHLISSPYSQHENQLHLPSLDDSSRLLALALSTMTPIQSDYALAPYLSSFNWSYIFQLLQTLCQQANHVWKAQEFYVVIFRSKLLPTANRDRLGLLDQKSHEEACSSGGLLKYWFGSADAERHNLATCLWRNREDAAAGGKGPWHAQARAAAGETYESISFHTHRLVIEDHVKSWRLEEYQHQRPHRS